MRLLTVAEVVELHWVLIERYGGLEGGGQRGEGNQGAEAAVSAVRNSYYEDPYEFAAAYAVYIVQGHVFADGNKRTASAAMFTFLKSNGIPFDAAAQDPRHMIELQRRAKSGERTSAIIEWLSRILQGGR